jgi:hypothetical protein
LKIIDAVAPGLNASGLFHPRIMRITRMKNKKARGLSIAILQMRGFQKLNEDEAIPAGFN